MTRLRVLLLILYVLLIFFLSSRPYLQAPGPDFALKDKVAHAVEYIVLGVLLYTGVGWLIKRPRFTLFWILFAIGATLAAVDEVWQSFIPGRFTDVHDWMADTVGVALGIISAMFILGDIRTDRARRGGEAI